MNAELFILWLKNMIFPNLKSIGRRCVLVLDRASYHTTVTDDTKFPTKSWTKNKLCSAITRWGGPFNEEWPLVGWEKLKLKAQLLEEAKDCHPGIIYEVQKLADSFSTPNFDIKILFLPVAHPDLNPIEMVWGTVKSAIQAKNLAFNINEVVKLTEHELKKIDAHEFSKYVRHVQRIEDKYCESDSGIDKIFDDYLKNPVSVLPAENDSNYDTETDSAHSEDSIPIDACELQFLEESTDD